MAPEISVIKCSNIEELPPTMKDGAPKAAANEERPMRMRDLVGFWILGLCNNYGYVVMLSGAHDILMQKSDGDGRANVIQSTAVPLGHRECNEISTGAILLADILPGLFIKLLSPFLPQSPNVRMVCCVFLSAVGFLLVAFAEVDSVAILGVIFTSLASGLGEATLLAYSSHYNKNVISTWSSGTGGAGVFGATSYALLIQIGLSARDTLLLMLIIPCLMCIAFWGILSKPNIRDYDRENNRTVSQEDIIKTETCDLKCKPLLLNITENSAKIPPLLVYMVPLLLVYFFEYFINQGLFELIHFDDFWLAHDQQYRWLQVAYQIGVFISRSSVNIFTVNKIWLLALLQGVNVIIFATEALYYYVPSFWIVLAFTVWEGLLGGGAYVNTYYKISKELPDAEREFALGTVSMSDALGITLSGFAAIPAHNWICGLSLPDRLFKF